MGLPVDSAFHQINGPYPGILGRLISAGATLKLIVMSLRKSFELFVRELNIDIKFLSWSTFHLYLQVKMILVIHLYPTITLNFGKCMGPSSSGAGIE